MIKLTWESFITAISDYVGADVRTITEETDFYEDLYLDSLGVFGLGTYITETFQLSLPLSSVATVSKVGEIFSLLVEKGVPTEA
jgi:acyl carrier protein